ncbi:hypothetical protein R6Q59_034538 [Mikania micrantha]
MLELDLKLEREMESKKNMGQSLIFITLWAIRKARNDRIFNNIKKESTKVVEEIKVLSLLWIKNKAKLNLVQWMDWSNFDVSL